MSNGTFQLRNTHGMPVETDELVADMRRVAREIDKTFSQGPYNRRFGSWTAALEAFSTMPTEVVSNQRRYSPTRKLPDAQRVETLPFGFVGRYFNVTASPVAQTVQVRR